MKVMYLLASFPPAGGSITIRHLKLVKYLAKMGIKTYVVAPEYSDDFPYKDAALVDEIPETCKVYRFSPTGNPVLKFFRYFMLAWKIVREHNPDWVVTRSPADSYQILGWFVSNLFGLKWNASVQEPVLRGRFGLPGKAIRFLLRYADLLTSGWKPEDMFPEELRRHNKTLWLPYGYDPEDLEGIDVTPSKKNKGMEIVHFGSLSRPAQDPTHLIQVIGELKRKGRLDGAGLRVRFLGSIYGDSFEEELERIIRKENVEEVISLEGYVEHPRGVKEVAGADVGLIVHAGYNLSCKIFEYLGVRKHVLAYYRANTPLERMVKGKTGITWVDYGDRDGLREALLKLLEQRGIKRPTARYCEQFRQDRLGEKLARTYAEII